MKRLRLYRALALIVYILRTDFPASEQLHSAKTKPSGTGKRPGVRFGQSQWRLEIHKGCCRVDLWPVLVGNRAQEAKPECPMCLADILERRGPAAVHERKKPLVLIE